MPPRSRRPAPTSVRARSTTSTSTAVSVDQSTFTFVERLSQELKSFLDTHDDSSLRGRVSQWRTDLRTFAMSNSTTSYLFQLLQEYIDPTTSSRSRLEQLHTILSRLLTTHMDIPSLHSRLTTILAELREHTVRTDVQSKSSQVEFILQHSNFPAYSTLSDIKEKLDYLGEQDFSLLYQLRQLAQHQLQDNDRLWTLAQWKEKLVHLSPLFRLFFDLKSFQQMQHEATFSPWSKTTLETSTIHSGPAPFLVGLPIPTATVFAFVHSTLLFPTTILSMSHFLRLHYLDGFWAYIQQHPTILPPESPTPNDIKTSLNEWSKVLKWPLLDDPYFTNPKGFRYHVFPWTLLLTLPFTEWELLMTHPKKSHLLDASSSLYLSDFLYRYAGRTTTSLIRLPVDTHTRRPPWYAMTAAFVRDDEDETSSVFEDVDPDDRSVDEEDLSLFFQERQSQDDSRHDDESSVLGLPPEYEPEIFELTQEQEQVMVVDEHSQGRRTITTTIQQQQPATLEYIIRWPFRRRQRVTVSSSTTLRAFIEAFKTRRSQEASDTFFHVHRPTGTRFVLYFQSLPLPMSKTFLEARIPPMSVLYIEIERPSPVLPWVEASQRLQKDWMSKTSVAWRILLLHTRPWIQHYHYTLIQCLSSSSVKYCHVDQVTHTPHFFFPTQHFFTLVANTPHLDCSQNDTTFHCGKESFKLLHVLQDGSHVLQRPSLFKDEIVWCAQELDRFLKDKHQRRRSIEQILHQPFSILNDSLLQVWTQTVKAHFVSLLQPLFSVYTDIDLDRITHLLCQGIQYSPSMSIYTVLHQLATFSVWCDPQWTLLRLSPTFHTRLKNFAFQFEYLISFLSSSDPVEIYRYIWPEFWSLTIDQQKEFQTALHAYHEFFIRKFWISFYTRHIADFKCSSILVMVVEKQQWDKLPPFPVQVEQVLTPLCVNSSTTFPIVVSVDEPPQWVSFAQLANAFEEGEETSHLPESFGTIVNSTYAQYGDQWSIFEHFPFPLTVSLSSESLSSSSPPSQPPALADVITTITVNRPPTRLHVDFVSTLLEKIHGLLT